MDMTQTIVPKSDQINADDLLSGPRTITITRVSGNAGSAEQPVNVFFEGDGGKPFRPCKSMRRVMVAAWGPDAAAYVSRSMTLYRDPEVAFGGMKVGGIRISHMSHLEHDLNMALTASKAQRKPYTVRRLADAARQRQEPKPESQDTPPEMPAGLHERATLAARQGSVTFTSFWQQEDVKPHRAALKRHLADYQRLAKEADENGAPDEADPFSGAGPDDEERARAEREAQEELAARDRAEGVA